MLAKGKTQQVKLAISYSNPLLESSSRSVSAPEWNPCGSTVPAMPDSLLLLQVLLSGPVVNVQTAAEAIRSDVGLTIRFLQFVGSQDDSAEVSISKQLVLAGVSRLRALTATTEIIARHPKGRAGLKVCERFWAHARLTALMAEELAQKKGAVDSEQAYLAGLLFRIGELPEVLGWEDHDLLTGCDSDRGHALAVRWNLPLLLREVIRADEETCSPEAYELLTWVKAADQQAFQIENLVTKYARGVF